MKLCLSHSSVCMLENSFSETALVWDLKLCILIVNTTNQKILEKPYSSLIKLIFDIGPFCDLDFKIEN